MSENKLIKVYNWLKEHPKFVKRSIMAAAAITLISTVGDMMPIERNLVISDKVNLTLPKQKREKITYNLEEILKSKYPENEVIFEKPVYDRIIGHYAVIDLISQSYSNLSPEMISAVIKKESLGKTGRVVSKTGARGKMQIKSEGAWKFFYNAAFKKKIFVGHKFKTDYFTLGIRNQYRDRMDVIIEYLDSKGVIVKPKNQNRFSIEAARKNSWEKLKPVLDAKSLPGDYQVGDEIGAMYLDHLATIISDHKARIDKLSQYFRRNPSADFRTVKFFGIEKYSWKRVKDYVGDDIIRIDHKNPKLYISKKWKRSNVNKSYSSLRKKGFAINSFIADRLDKISDRLNDPTTLYASYNLGPTCILRNIESGKPIPKDGLKYANDVLFSLEIFGKLYAQK